MTSETTTVVDYEIRYQDDGEEPDRFEDLGDATDWQDWRRRTSKDPGVLWQLPVTTTVVYGEWEQVPGR